MFVPQSCAIGSQQESHGACETGGASTLPSLCALPSLPPLPSLGAAS
jgi:hypothetical protein